MPIEAEVVKVLGTIAADVKRVEDAAVVAASHVLADVEAKIAPMSQSLKSLEDEVHSIIDDTVASSEANTWSINQITKFVEEKLASVQAGVPVNPIVAVETDLVAVYLAAKTALSPAPAPAPEAPAITGA